MWLINRLQSKQDWLTQNDHFWGFFHKTRQGVPVSYIKRQVTGKGNASKKEVIEAVRALGYHPQDDNEADAIALIELVFKSVCNQVGKGRKAKWSHSGMGVKDKWNWFRKDLNAKWNSCSKDLKAMRN